MSSPRSGNGRALPSGLDTRWSSRCVNQAFCRLAAFGGAFGFALERLSPAFFALGFVFAPGCSAFRCGSWRRSRRYCFSRLASRRGGRQPVALWAVARFYERWPRRAALPSPHLCAPRSRAGASLRKPALGQYCANMNLVWTNVLCHVCDATCGHNSRVHNRGPS